MFDKLDTKELLEELKKTNKLLLFLIELNMTGKYSKDVLKAKIQELSE